MLFYVDGRDRPGGEAEMDDLAEAHWSYMDRFADRLILRGPTLSDGELLAICETAHDAGAIVTVHAQGPGQVARALGAGIDEVAHCPWSERLPDGLIDVMAKRVRIVSTLDIHSYGRDTPELRVATDNLQRFLQAGGRVAYGTDLGNGSIPPGIHVDEAWHLTRAGLSPEQMTK